MSEEEAAEAKVTTQAAEMERLKAWQRDQLALIDDTGKLVTELHTEKKAAEAALASAKAEVERLRGGIADIEDAANSFCDESGDEVAGQIRIRARSLLEPSEEPK